MALDALKSALPDYARELRLNLGSVVERSVLSPQRLWGTVLVCAIAVHSAAVLREVTPEARRILTPEAYHAAMTTSAVMAANNVFFRTRHLLPDPAYQTLRPGLRTVVPATPGVPRTDVELWSLAISAVNGCGACLDSHEAELRAAGETRETVQEAFKIASVIQAAATVIDAEDVLGRL